MSGESHEPIVTFPGYEPLPPGKPVIIGPDGVVLEDDVDTELLLSELVDAEADELEDELEDESTLLLLLL